MRDLIFHILFFLCYVTVISAHVSPQDYWNFKLPNTSIPQSIKRSLPTSDGNPILQTISMQRPASERLLSSNANSLKPNDLSVHKINHDSEEPNNVEFTIPTLPLFLYSKRESANKLNHHVEESNDKEFTVPTLPLFLYSKKESENKINHHGEELNDKEFKVPTLPLFLYSKKQPQNKINPDEEESNDKKFSVPTLPLFLYSKRESGNEINNDGDQKLSKDNEFTIPTLPLFLYSKKDLENKMNYHDEKSNNNDQEFTVPTLPLFLYSKKEPQNKINHDSDKSTNKEFTVPTLPLFLYSKKESQNKMNHDSDESTNKEFTVPTLPLFLYSKKESENKINHNNKKSTNKEFTVPTLSLFLYSKKEPENKINSEESTIEEFTISKLPLHLYSKSQFENSKEGPMVIFVEKELHRPGKTVTLQFKRGTKKALFLPRIVANKIPFSSDRLQETLNLLSIDPNSGGADIISETISACGEKAIEGLVQKCVTSLESMVDFVVSNIGNDVRALTSKVGVDYPKMKYTIEKVERLTKNDNEAVICHKKDYPYALYYCHASLSLRPYKVSLVGEDGTKIETMASCHKEVGDAVKSYMVDVMKVVPGSTHLCHIATSEDNIIFAAN